MTEDDLCRISERGRTLLGIELGTPKRQMLHSRLARRLRAVGASSFSSYLDFLDTPAGAGEIEYFGNALTTNLTSFFREVHHFTHFEQEIRRRPDLPGNRLRVWSAGCSTGEEAYSLAMILHANADALAGRDRRVLATDIDTEVLAAAMAGTYPSERLRLVPARFRTPTFMLEQGTSASVTDRIKEIVVFRILNLIHPWPFKGRFNVIFCRNVLIYLTPELRLGLIDRFVDLIHPGGLLYLGHSESALGAHPRLVAEGHTIYRVAA